MSNSGHVGMRRRVVCEEKEIPAEASQYRFMCDVIILYDAIIAVNNVRKGKFAVHFYDILTYIGLKLRAGGYSKLLQHRRVNFHKHPPVGV